MYTTSYVSGYLISLEVEEVMERLLIVFVLSSCVYRGREGERKSNKRVLCVSGWVGGSVSAGREKEREGQRKWVVSVCQRERGSEVVRVSCYL